MTKNSKVLGVSEVTDRVVRQLREMSMRRRLTIGLDLGDRTSNFCVVNEAEGVELQGKVGTTKAGMAKLFEGLPAMRVVMETGTHSPWVSRQLKGYGLEAVVANARNVAWISRGSDKTDRADAEKLAQLGRAGLKWLEPVEHRGEQAHKDLMVIRARATVVEARTKLINAVRGLVKGVGERVAACESEQVNASLVEGLSPEARTAVAPMVKVIETMNEQIAVYDQQLGRMSKRYPETKLLLPIQGVGLQVALTFVLTIEDAKRFGKSRDVGAYLGLTPGKDQSGERDAEKGIHKEGDKHLRWLLVQAAHCVLRQGAPDSDLRRWGLAKLGALGADGKELDGPQAKDKMKASRRNKKRIVVAVARKLAVLMHHLWVNGEVYDPLYEANRKAAASQKAA